MKLVTHVTAGKNPIYYTSVESIHYDLDSDLWGSGETEQESKANLAAKLDMFIKQLVEVKAALEVGL